MQLGWQSYQSACNYGWLWQPHHLDKVNASRCDFASTTSHALPTTAVVNNVADSDETLEPI